MRAVLLAAALAVAAVPAAAQTVDVTGPAGQVIRVDAAALAAMPQARATLSGHGETHVWEGPLLIDVSLGRARPRARRSAARRWPTW